MPITPNKRSIDRAIKHLGVEVHGKYGDGCYYFCSLKTGNTLDATSVYAARFNQLPLERWVKEAEESIKEDGGRADEPDKDFNQVISLRGHGNY